MKIVNVAAAVIRDGNRIFATQRGYGEFKDMWEFPGGKIEEGETAEQALIREIREELDADILVNGYIDTVEYDYPSFHLSMQCFWCEPGTGSITLLEHESAAWLKKDELMSVNWLPADLELIPVLKKFLQ